MAMDENLNPPSRRRHRDNHQELKNDAANTIADDLNFLDQMSRRFQNRPLTVEERAAATDTLATATPKERQEMQGIKKMLAGLDQEYAALMNDEINALPTEAWRKDGVLHRSGGPAAIWRDRNTNVVVREEWRQYGKASRKDGPANIWRDAATGKVTAEEWWQDGKRNGRPGGGPDVVQRDPTSGIVTYESYHKNGLTSREDGPARIKRDANTGVVTKEEWVLNGVRHRLIERDSTTGKTTYESQDGKVIIPKIKSSSSFHP